MNTRLGRCAFIWLVAGCGARGELRAPTIGAPAPPYVAMNLDGAAVRLDSLQGSVVVLNIWATWCEPCRDEIPQLQALHDSLGARGMTMLGVSIDEPGMGSEVSDFARSQGMTYPIWLDPSRDVAAQFLTIGVPETFVIDRAGKIRFRLIGALRRGDTTLVAAIRAALDS